MKRPKRMHLAFLVAMAVTLSLPGILPAQNGGMMGGVLVDEEDQLPGRRGLMNRDSGPQSGMGNQTFGLDLEENYTPIGSGGALLLAAGVGYALLKSKRTEKQTSHQKTQQP